MSRVVDYFDGQFKDRMEKSEEIRRPFGISRAVKRTIDILGSAVGLLVLSPLFAFVAIRLKKDSPGPVYFHGPRTGLRGKIFQIYKFRTMYECPQSYEGAPVTAKDDKRITPFGQWLRESKINELPQLWNVLKGDMSIVGPRPEVPEIVVGWSEEARREILSMRPGITSPASVMYRDEQEMLSSGSVMDEYLRTILPDKQRLDQLYVRNYSCIGDLDVIFMTLTLIIPLWRDTQVKEQRIFEGPLTWIIQKFMSWLVIDTVVAFFAISLVVLIWRVSAPFDIGFFLMVAIAAILAFGLAITNTLFGVKNINWRYASPVHVIDLIISTLFAMGIFILVFSVILEIRLPFPLLVDFGFVSCLGFIIVRYRERLITGIASRWMRWRAQSSKLGERVLVIGAGDCGQLALWLLEKSKLSPAFSVVGFVDDDFHKVNMRINGIPVLGTVQDIPQIVTKKSIGLVMFAINKIHPNNRDAILKWVEDLPVRVLMIPDLLTILSDYFTQQAKKEALSNE